ncbi:DUF4245 domain-containing protein [Actinoplanes lobatus]|uniref:DUF4245 domain-containing protein n=2 Tax=Actinoplanes lobatus TaxID=113568 RepID=A0A7W7HAP6_9ACTN|nr:DUF4245 domain-containing protein [Actinoplanes lobatus]MBB4747126.1 hypothetical protein [Actinoplanes lobatus]
MEPTPAEPQPSPRLSAREGRSPRDMITSLLVLLVPIALCLTFYRVVLDGDKPISIDPAETIQTAQRAFPVAQPRGLGEDDWHVSSAAFRRVDGGATLRIGYVGPAGKAMQLVQSTVAPTTLIPAEVGDSGKRTGAYRTDERVWMEYAGRPGETALIFTEPARTIVIIGDDSDTENLEKLASSLS